MNRLVYLSECSAVQILKFTTKWKKPLFVSLKLKLTFEFTDKLLNAFSWLLNLTAVHRPKHALIKLLDPCGSMAIELSRHQAKGLLMRSRCHNYSSYKGGLNSSPTTQLSRSNTQTVRPQKGK